MDFNNPNPPDSSINTFINNFNSFARPNRFSIDFIAPAGVASGTGSEVVLPIVLGPGGASSKADFAKPTFLKDVSIACSSLSMPGRNISYYQDYQTNSYYANKMECEPAYATFYCSDDLQAKRFFDMWQETVINVKNRSANFYNEYVADVRMNQIDRHGKITYSVILKEAFPQYINTIEYSMSNYDSVLETTVTFYYKYWTSSKIT